MSAADTNVLNIVNFIRACEPRHPEIDLLQTVKEEMALSLEYQLPTTWLFQYDALTQGGFSDCVRSAMAPDHECGIWFELNRANVEAAGLPWRGRYDWDWHVECGFSLGYTPEERERIADVLFNEFKRQFGEYPRSMGSWIFDAHLLEYVHRRYGVIAACNCKDQYGTDGYTLWGGYWANAYYPSRVNAYMPAQTPAEQINVPVFRMLGSDPLDQYDGGLGTNGQCVITLEPVYKFGGGDPAWVDWYLRETYREPHFALAYAQAGQENSFGAPSIMPGLRIQFPRFAELRKAGKIRVETMSETAVRFRKQHPQTPVTAQVTLTDKPGQNRQGIWYLSRFQRLNFCREADGCLYLRDWHVFTEKLAEPFLDKPCPEHRCSYLVPAIFDSFLWQAKCRLTETAGEIADVRDEGNEVLSARFGGLTLRCAPDMLELHGTGAVTMELNMKMPADQGMTLAVFPDRIEGEFQGVRYGIRMLTGSLQQIPEGIRLVPENGTLKIQIVTE